MMLEPHDSSTRHEVVAEGSEPQGYGRCPRGDRPKDAAVEPRSQTAATAKERIVASSGQELVNPVTGERIVFRRTSAETAGELLEFDDFWTRPGHRVPEHVHPHMEERWEVVAGTAAFSIGGAEVRAEPGEIVVASPGTPHMGWNPTADLVHLRVQMRPALRWEEFTERLFELARCGHVDANGLPEPPDLFRLLEEFRNEIAPPPTRGITPAG